MPWTCTMRSASTASWASPRPTSARAAATEGDYWENEWGMGYRRQAYGTGEYGEQVHHPLAGATTVEEVEAYPWPSPDWYDYSQLPGLAAQYPGRAIECGYTAVFYFHNQLRGLEQSLMDPADVALTSRASSSSGCRTSSLSITAGASRPRRA